MPIAYRAGSTNVSTGSTTATSFTIVLSASAVPGDVMIVSTATNLFASTAANAISYSSTTGKTAPTQIEQSNETDTGSNQSNTLAIWQLVVAQGDPGATLTFTVPTASAWAIAAASYSGVDTTTPISASAITTGSTPEVSSLASPNATPAHTDCWGLTACNLNGGGNAVAPAGLSSRQLTVSSSQDGDTGISDSNACIPIKAAWGASFSWTSSAADDMQAATIILKAAPRGVHHRMAPVIAISDGTASPSVAANFNSYSPVKGDLILLFITSFGTTSSSINTPAGYTSLITLTQASVTAAAIFYRYATGGDSAPTCTGTTAGTAADASFSVAAFILFDSSGVAPVLYGSATHGGTSGTNTVTSATNVLCSDAIGIAVERASQGTTAAITTWTIPSGWTAATQETASLRSQSATQWIGGPAINSTLASLFTHSRTSTEQAAALVIVGSPPPPPPIDTPCGAMVLYQGVNRAATR